MTQRVLFTLSDIKKLISDRFNIPIDEIGVANGEVLQIETIEGINIEIENNTYVLQADIIEVEI